MGQLTFIRDETVIVFSIAAFFNQDINLLSLQLLSEGEKDMFQFTQHHGSVLHFVVQLQAFNKVLVGAGVLGLLDLAVDWEELGILEYCWGTNKMILVHGQFYEKHFSNIVKQKILQTLYYIQWASLNCGI